MKEKDLAKNVFIILRGTGEETCNSRLSDLLVTKQPGMMVGMLQLVSEDPSRYLTSFIADSHLSVRAIPLQAFRRVVQQSVELQQFVWKQCLYEFIKVHTQHLSSLAYLTQPELNRIVTLSHIAFYSRGEKVSLPQGGVFL